MKNTNSLNKNRNDENCSNNWLFSYRKNITSQCGEDGIFEKIFEIIKGDKWCVEFGAWDGKFLSNTWNLIINKGWSSVLIEADKKKSKDLIKTYEGKKRVICLNKFVEFSGNNSLDNILSKTPISQSFDLLSIDIDGNDYHIWDSMKKYNPKVVIIEFNPSFPNDIQFVQQKNMKINQGSSLLSLTKLGEKKDYELVAVTEINAIFVKKQYFKLFGIKDNSLSSMYVDKKYQTRIFQLFDGTLVLNGCSSLIWHGIRIKQKKIQVLPRFLRFHPPNVRGKPFIKSIFNSYKRLIFDKIVKKIKITKKLIKNDFK